MRVYISADMEGATGITDPKDVRPGEPGYQAGRQAITGDVNAAVTGALSAGAETVVVNDAHGPMTNLPRSELHEEARLIRGNTKPWGQMQGLTEDADVAFLVGYHAKAGTQAAILNHTILSAAIYRLWVNGDEAGEAGFNGGLANAHEVPVGLVTGDDKTQDEALDWFGDGLETVRVKTGIDRFTADCRPPAQTRPAIREAATRAVERADDDGYAQAAPAEPTTVEVEWKMSHHARGAGQAAGAERVDGRRTRAEADSYAAAFEATVRMVKGGMAAHRG